MGTESHWTISKRSRECWFLIGHKKCFVLFCPIGEQHLLSSFREFVHDSFYLRHICPIRSPSLPNQKRRNYRWVEKRFGCYKQEQFNLHWENSVSDGSQCIVNNRKFKMKRRRKSKKSNSLTRQNNNFARASRFFAYISLPSLHDFHVKMLNFTFCEGRKQAKIFFLFMNLDMVDRNSAQEEFACIWQSKWVGVITIETEKIWVHSSCDVFVVVSWSLK